MVVDLSLQRILLIIVAVTPIFAFEDRDVPTNCIVGGGGSQEPYIFCPGCHPGDAMNCISKMRTNSSGNVPSQCDISALTERPMTECCPSFQDIERPWTIVDGTAAYPDALRCLEDVRCEKIDMFTQLTKECEVHGCAYCLPRDNSSNFLRPTMTVIVVWVAFVVVTNIASF